MTWSSRVAKSARKQIRALSRSWQREILAAIRDLSSDPFVGENIELARYRNVRRLRVGKFRIIFRVGKNVVYVIQVEKRGDDTYRKFNPPRGTSFYEDKP